MIATAEKKSHAKAQRRRGDDQKGPGVLSRKPGSSDVGGISDADFARELRTLSASERPPTRGFLLSRSGVFNQLHLVDQSQNRALLSFAHRLATPDTLPFRFSASLRRCVRTAFWMAVCLPVIPGGTTRAAEELVVESALLRLIQQVEVPARAWNAPSGGHHIDGILRFPAVDASGNPILAGAGEVTLIFHDLAGAGEQVLTWALADSE